MPAAQQWYMAIGGHQVGPVSQDEIISNLKNGSIDAETLSNLSRLQSFAV